jgi:hypothetical protein
MVYDLVIKRHDMWLKECREGGKNTNVYEPVEN